MTRKVCVLARRHRQRLLGHMYLAMGDLQASPLCEEGRVMTEKAARSCTEKEVCLTGVLLFTTLLCIDPTNNCR